MDQTVDIDLLSVIGKLTVEKGVLQDQLQRTHLSLQEALAKALELEVRLTNLEKKEGEPLVAHD